MVFGVPQLQKPMLARPLPVSVFARNLKPVLFTLLPTPLLLAGLPGTASAQSSPSGDGSVN
jgi:hypothetical protein